MEFQSNTSDANRTFKNLLNGINNATPLMQAIAESCRRSIEDCFDNEAAPDGSPWAELNPHTLESKLRKGLSLRKNEASGRMRQEITYRVYPSRVEIRAEAPYSSYANKRRQFLPENLGTKGEAEIEAISDRYINTLAGK